MNSPALTRLVCFVFIIAQISCATTQKTAIATPANDVASASALSFDPAREYELIIVNQPGTVRVSGKNITVQNGRFLITDETGGIRQIYDADKVGAIYVIDKTAGGSRKKHLLTGLAIGAGTGLVSSLILGIGAQNWASGCNDDPVDCRNIAKAVWAIGVPAFTLIGGGIGTGIGALLPVKK